MPELPEVETVRRGLVPYLEGHVIQSVQISRYDLRRPVSSDLGQRLTGQRVSSLSRRGKLMIWRLDGPDVVILHLGMSGRCSVVPLLEYEPQKHDHVRVILDSDNMIVFNDPRRFGFFDICPLENLEQDSLFSRMGPEPLSDDFTWCVLQDALLRRSGPIKNVLLDQTVVAGLGNIYVCEALYRAGIAPERAANSLSVQSIKFLAQAIRDVLIRAVEVGGSTLKDHRRPDGTTGYFQIEFSVYGKEGEFCPDFENENSHKIKRIVQSGRSTFYCPACQS